MDPPVIISSHGQALKGPAMLAALQELAREFRDLAIPEEGRYYNDPQYVKKGQANRDPDQ